MGGLVDHEDDAPYVAEGCDCGFEPGESSGPAAAKADQGDGTCCGLGKAACWVCGGGGSRD